LGCPESGLYKEKKTKSEGGAMRRLILVIGLTLTLLLSILSCTTELSPSPSYNPQPESTEQTSAKPSTTPERTQPKSTAQTSAKPSTTPERTQPKSTAQTIELKLPFKTNHEPEGMMPMGETINHPPPMGHPGIDFQWPYKEAEIIIALDGVVGDITTEVSTVDGDTVYFLTVITGDFAVKYEVVDLPKFNPNLQIGDEVVYGMILGYPQAIVSSTWRMIHWGFGKVFENRERKANPEGVIESYYFDWLCPMEYFTESERLRLEQIWEDANYNHKDEFPNLCNGYYELPEQ
jgi:hypothetical protein